MSLERIEIIERVEPGEAARRGLPPKEYVEFGITPEVWDGIGGNVAASTLSMELKEMVVVYPRFVSLTGNIVVEVNREHGPRATVKDHIVYLSKKVGQTLRRK